MGLDTLRYLESEPPRRRRWSGKWPRQLQRIRNELGDLRMPPRDWDGSWLVVAQDCDGPVGYAWTRPIDDEWGYVEEVAVLSAWQGRGIGTSLLIEAVRTASRRGLKRLTIFPLTERKGWVERGGFALLGETAALGTYTAIL